MSIFSVHVNYEAEPVYQCLQTHEFKLVIFTANVNWKSNGTHLRVHLTPNVAREGYIL
jgi:hypothetical protein